MNVARLLNIPGYVLLLSVVIGVCVSCSAPLGTQSLHKKDSDGSLVSPWHAANINMDNLIQKTTLENKNSGKDHFAIYLTDAYFKYLPDFGSTNEVIVVMEFVETVNGTEEDKVVKILGPYKHLSDKSMAPFMNKLVYGPKRLESSHLTLKLTVLEYDQEENKNTADLFDFIASSADALALADPITMAERKVTKEIAKSLLSLNKDDVILSVDMDFVGGDKGLLRKTNDLTQVLPLQAGEFFLVKQEACSIGKCFSFFSGKNDYNPVGYIADGVMAIPVALMRGLTDTPDNAALQEFNSADAKIEHGRPVLTSSSSSSSSSEPSKVFNDKTWLRFNVVQGGDPSEWDVRKKMSSVDQAFYQLLQKKGNLESDSFNEAIKSLQDARAEVNKVKAVIEVTEPQVYGNDVYLLSTKTTPQLCVRFPAGATVVAVNLLTVPPLPATPQIRTLTLSAATPQNQCYALQDGGKTTLDKGDYSVQVSYYFNGQPLAYATQLHAVEAVTITSVAQSADKSKLTIVGTNLSLIKHLVVTHNGVETEAPVVDKGSASITVLLNKTTDFKAAKISRVATYYADDIAASLNQNNLIIN